jgi:hypothetical protein
MANIRKQFNFRNGVQVDDDNLVVSATGLVGIGTTIPTEALDVRGNAKIVGNAVIDSITTPSLTATDTTIANISLTGSITGSGVSITSGVVTSSSGPAGLVTYYGDGRYLQGLPTSQWLDIDVGLGYTSIYAQGNVGVSTVDPRFPFQVGGNNDNTLSGFSGGVGIGSDGNVIATGIVTAGSFVGFGSDITGLTGSNIAYGTIDLDRLPTIPDSKLNPNQNLGIVTTTDLESENFTTTDIQVGGGLTVSGDSSFNTASFSGLTSFDSDSTFSGNVTVNGTITGTATTAQGLTGSPNIVVGILTASAVAASSFIGGITGDVTGTASTARSLTADAKIDIVNVRAGLGTFTTQLEAELLGIGTDSPVSDITVRRSGDAEIQVISDTGTALLSVGRNQTIADNNAVLRYGDTSGMSPYSTYDALDLINYGNGNYNYYLQAGNVGINTGSYYWHYKSTERLMSLTYEGNLGVGYTNPTSRLQVAGETNTTTLITSSDATVGNDLNVSGQIGAGVSIAAPIVYINNGRDGLLDSTGTSLFSSSNVDILSGISTFHDINVEGTIQVESNYQTGGGLKIGSLDEAEYERPLAPLQVGNGSADPELVVLVDEGQVGIGTTVIGNELALNCTGNAVFNRVGVNTTSLNNLPATLYVSGGVVVEPGPDEIGNPVLSVTGIVTATDGFSSDGSGPVKITVSGSTLTFTVDGVGSASLTLS